MSVDQINNRLILISLHKYNDFIIGLGKILKPAISVEINSVYTNNDVCKDIKCDFDATCEVGPDGFPRCSCIFNCSIDNSPVCGSDVRIYNSLCLMKMEGCQRQQELRLRPMELCQGT